MLLWLRWLRLEVLGPARRPTKPLSLPHLCFLLRLPLPSARFNHTPHPHPTPTSTTPPPQRLGPEDSQFIYDAAAAHCLDIATHRHGCCVLQRCIDYATNPQKRALIERIADHSLMLSQVGWGGRGCLPARLPACAGWVTSEPTVRSLRVGKAMAMFAPRQPRSRLRRGLALPLLARRLPFLETTINMPQLRPLVPAGPLRQLCGAVCAGAGPP